MLTLYIQKKVQTIITKDQQTATTYCVEANTDLERCDLHDLPPQYDLTELKIVDARKKKSNPIVLPAHVSAALNKYLRCYQAREDWSFDCLSLANLVVGLPTHPKHLLWRFWNMTPIKFGPLQRQRISPGNIVFFISEKVFHHAAINIDKDLYISVWGAGGDLEFTDLKRMERAFSAKQVARATPRN